MGRVRIAMLSLAAVLGSTLAIGDASAKPIDQWVCGPYSCYWGTEYWDYYGWNFHRRTHLVRRYYRWDFGGDWW
jgi:hypothetical protein